MPKIGYIQTKEHRTRNSVVHKKRYIKPILEPTLCECGCDGLAKPGKRFINGHNGKGKHYGAGKKKSEKTKAKMKISAIKKYEDPKEREKRSVALTGVSKSPEHCAVLKEAQNCSEVKLAKFVSMKADLNPSWKGGIGKLPYSFNFNNELKELICKRDGHICQLCSKTQKENGRKLDVHHKDYIKDNLDPNNLISLCRSCNVKINFNREYWIEFFKFN